MRSQLEKLKKDTSSVFLFIMPVLRISQEIQEVHTPSEFIIIDDHIPLWSELLKVKFGSVPTNGTLSISFHSQSDVQSDVFNHSFEDENPSICFSLVSLNVIVQRGSRLDFIIVLLSDIKFNLRSSS